MNVHQSNIYLHIWDFDGLFQTLLDEIQRDPNQIGYVADAAGGTKAFASH